MFKISTANNNYNIFYPFLTNRGGLEQAQITTEIQKHRELQVRINPNAQTAWQFLRDEVESKLILELDDYRMGFFKNSSNFTHLLVIGTMGQGTDANTAISFSNNEGYFDPNYQLDFNFSASLGGVPIFYIFNPFSGLTNNRFAIKTFDMQQNDSTGNTVDNVEQVRARLYDKALQYIRRVNRRLSIDRQINRLGGVSDITFLSSSAEMSRNQRILPINFIYNGSAIGFLQSLGNPNIRFDLVSPDIDISIQTGALNNYELLNEVCKGVWSWREVGQVRTGTTTDAFGRVLPIWTTVIEVGNFFNLPTTGKLANHTIDNPFYPSLGRITNVRELFPLLDVDITINRFILEGSRLDIDVKDYLQGLQRTYQNFDIQTTKFFDGFTRGIDLYRLG